MIESTQCKRKWLFRGGYYFCCRLWLTSYRTRSINNADVQITNQFQTYVLMRCLCNGRNVKLSILFECLSILSFREQRQKGPRHGKAEGIKRLVFWSIKMEIKGCWGVPALGTSQRGTEGSLPW